MTVLEKIYLHSKISPDLASLYTMRLIQNIAVGLFSLFLPIFLYRVYGFNITYVLIFYLASFGGYSLMVIPGAKLLNKLGTKKSITIGVIVYIYYFVCFYFFETNVVLFSVLALIMINLFRMFYWLPYHIDMTKFMPKKDRAKQISFLRSITTLVSIFVPVISAFIIVNYGFQVLFMIVIVLIVVSLIPVGFLPKTKEFFEWTVWQTIKNLFRKRNRRLVFAYFSKGIESMVGCAVWPIFIWLLLDQKYVTVGVVSGLVVLATVIIRLLIGNICDRYSKKKVLAWGTVFYSVGWFFKIFVQSAYHVFVASTFHSFSGVVLHTSFDSLTYERAADQGHYVDEYTVLKEIALNFGRGLTCIILIFLVASFGMIAAFILAAVASLFVSIF